MFAKSRLSGLLFVLLVSASSFGIAGCQRATPPPPPSTESDRPVPSKQDFGTHSSGATWGFTLQPLHADTEPNAAEVAKLGPNLFSGMAKDPKTLDLLKQLNADRSIELVVVDVKQAEDKKVMEAPPRDEYASVIRVTEPRSEDSQQTPGALRFRVTSLFITRNEAAESKIGDASDVIDKLKATGNVPLASFSLVLAMEDYVSRHAPGWAVRSATFSYRRSSEKLPSTIEEQRKDLDHWTQVYAQEARDYYAALKKAR